MSDRTVNALMHITNGLPPDQGTRLAKWVTTHFDSLEGVTIDVTRIPAQMLNSGFYTAFFRTVHALRPDLLEGAQRLTWITSYPFQQRTIQVSMETVNSTLG